MSTSIWLSNDDSDVSGYKVAYIGFRSPRASTTLSTAVTTMTPSGTNVAMTATSGGTAIKWLTAPFESDVVIAGAVFANIWGLESSASSNATFGVQLAEYTTSAQSFFMQTSTGTEVGTSAGQMTFVRFPAAAGDINGGIFTSTTIDAGNRLIILPIITNVGTMGAGNLTVTMDYNGSTAGADGDTYIEITETAYANRVQLPASGVSPSAPGLPSIIALTGMSKDLDPVVQQIASDSISWGALKNELDYLATVETA